jgi:hypothetical protein
MICTEIECRGHESVQKVVQSPGLFVCTLQSAHFEPSAHIEKCAEGLYVCRRCLCKERSLFTWVSTDLHSLGLLHTSKCAEGFKCADDLHTKKCAEAPEVCRSFSKCADVSVRSAHFNLHTFALSVQNGPMLRSAHIEKCAEGLCVQTGPYVCRFCLICTHNLHALKCAEGSKCADDFVSERR